MNHQGTNIDQTAAMGTVDNTTSRVNCAFDNFMLLQYFAADGRGQWSGYLSLDWERYAGFPVQVYGEEGRTFRIWGSAELDYWQREYDREQAGLPYVPGKYSPFACAFDPKHKGCWSCTKRGGQDQGCLARVSTNEHGDTFPRIFGCLNWSGRPVPTGNKPAWYHGDF